ncbi:hypothetical protein GCM10023185_30520 [Hymenobacter saemangeumensis]|uniref:4'-phosphopantetheinyl transferase superfamily protein n=1 Tax=Hymenobacter saemangeumensis TaxID=1084522 RepID=A0ABP8ILL5_9BACT
MPLYSLQRLSPTAILGLWQLQEVPDTLWPLLPQAAQYRALVPPTADATRQAQWLAGRVLAHELLRTLLGPEASAAVLLRNEASGRPWLDGSPAGSVVSLSHSGEWVAALLNTQGRAGIDIELVRAKARRLASKYLSEAEWAALPAPAEEAEALAHFSLLWSAKETLYKLAARRGIIFKEQLLLHSKSQTLSGELAATLVLDGSRTRHRICYSQPAPGYVLTYSFEDALPEPAVS